MARNAGLGNTCSFGAYGARGLLGRPPECACEQCARDGGVGADAPACGLCDPHTAAYGNPVLNAF